MSTEYRQDGRKGARLFLVVLALVAVSSGLTMVGLVEAGPDRVIPLAVGVAGLVLFGGAAFIRARRVIRASPLLTVTPYGLDLPDVGLRWQDIAEIRIDHARGQRFLGIVPRDIEGVLRRLPLAKRALARLSAATGFAPIAIPESGLAVSLEDVIAAIEQQRAGDQG